MSAFYDAIQDLTFALGCPDATLLIAIDQFEELLQESKATIETSSPEHKFLTFLQALFSTSNNRVLGLSLIHI